MLKLLSIVILLCCFGNIQAQEGDSGRIYYKTGQYEKALPFYIDALISTEKTLGKEHPNYGVRLNNLGNLYFVMGQYEKALPYNLEALSSVEKWSSNYVVFLSNLANLYSTIGQNEKALPLYLEALNTAEKWSSNYGVILSNLASLYVTLGQYEKALPLNLESLRNAEESLGKEHSQYGISLNNLADLYFVMGQYEKALPLYIDALNNIEKSLGKQHPQYATSLNNLAKIYNTLGQYDKALPLYIEGLSIVEKSLGKEHSDYGMSLNSLANFYESMGQYENALPLHLEALINVEKSLGKGNSNYGILLSDLAGWYESMGQYEKALPIYQESLSNIEKSLGKENSRYGNCLNNLAELYKSMGQYEKALPLYIEALSNTEKSLGKAHPAYGKRLGNLAGLYLYLGQFEKAFPLFLEALSNTEKSLGKEHPDYGTQLHNLAVYYNATFQYEEALPLFLESLRIQEKFLGENHADYAQSLNNLILLYNGEGKYEKVLLLCQEALGIMNLNIKKNFSFLSETEKEAYIETVLFNFAIYRSLFLKYRNDMPDIAAEAFDLELASSGMIFNAIKNIHQDIIESNNDTAINTYDQWVGLRTILAKNYALPIANRRLDIKALEEDANTLEGKLANFSFSFKQSKSIQNIKWKDVQNNLKQDEVAVEFSSYKYYNGERFSNLVEYVALVLRKGDKYPQVINLCEQKQLDSLLYRLGEGDESFVSGLYRNARVSSNAPNFESNAKLFDLIWKPMDSLLANIKTVYYSPSGSLNQISFAAIPYNDSVLLSDKYQLNQLTTTAKLVESNKDFSSPKFINVYGGIDYNVSYNEMKKNVKEQVTSTQQAVFTSRSFTPGSRGGDWPYLSGTLTEAKGIEKIAYKFKVKPTVMSGKSASEESFKNLSGKNSPNVIHVATHGFFFPNPEIDTNRLKKGFKSEERVAFQSDKNPLMRSGLLFAGAEHVWAGDTIPENVEDGTLTAYEVSNMYLPNTKLVVLSACETGLGDIKGSEGVFGLQRAFKMAGVENIIMSLWKVPDTETAEFMEGFYTSWFSGSTIDDAFRNTQNTMKKKYPHQPYKWAAFVLIR